MSRPEQVSEQKQVRCLTVCERFYILVRIFQALIKRGGAKGGVRVADWLVFSCWAGTRGEQWHRIQQGGFIIQRCPTSICSFNTSLYAWFNINKHLKRFLSIGRQIMCKT